MSTSRLVLPDSIKVGPYDYPVRRVSTDELPDVRGDFCTDAGIRIVRGLRRKVALETLQHEIFHAIWYSYNLPSKCKEEDAVSIISTGYMAVLLDNPSLWALMKEVIKHD